MRDTVSSSSAASDVKKKQPRFKEKKDGDYKMIGVFAKTARGLMTRYIIENKITNVAELKKFNDAGYKFNKSLSTATEWVFTRSS